MDELSSIVADPSFAGGQHNIKGLILDIFERALEGDERDRVMGILLRFVAVADLVKESGPLFKCVSVAGVFKHGNSFALLTDLLFRVFESKTLDAATRRTYLQIIGAALIAVAPEKEPKFKSRDFDDDKGREGSYWAMVRLASRGGKNGWTAALISAIERYAPAIEGYDASSPAPTLEAKGRVKQLANWFTALPDLDGEMTPALTDIHTRVTALSTAWNKS
jgi:hypothetical protein